MHKLFIIQSETSFNHIVCISSFKNALAFNFSIYARVFFLHILCFISYEKNYIKYGAYCLIPNDKHYINKFNKIRTVCKSDRKESVRRYLYSLYNSMSKYGVDSMYHQQQNKWYPQRCLLAYFQATLYFRVWTHRERQRVRARVSRQTILSQN